MSEKILMLVAVGTCLECGVGAVLVLVEPASTTMTGCHSRRLPPHWGLGPVVSS
jgi:hypothetical protein